MKRNNEYVGESDIPIKVIHKGVYKEVKICSTCNIVKPFRSHHCSDCDNCVINFDHHCPWIGGCVGRRNYIFFFIFLILLNIKNIFIGIFCILHIVYTYKDVTDLEKNNKKWVAIKLIDLIPTLLTIIFIGLTMAFTTGLIIYHIKLIMLNMSTKDDIKKLIFTNIGNPYDRGCAKNCNEFWTKHLAMKNNYTVKELRIKAKVDNNTVQNKNKNEIPKIMPYAYSKKEKELMNKNKKDKNSDNISNNEQNNLYEKESKSEKYDASSESQDIANNNQLFKKIKERIKNKERKSLSKKSEKERKNSSRRSSRKSSNSIRKRNSKKGSTNKNNIDFKKQNEDDDFTDEEISEENDNINKKICNTSVKNKNNLNQNFMNKINNVELDLIKNRSVFSGKNSNLLNLSKEEKGQQIAQKRLDELSSEIPVFQELKSSMSIPDENSFKASLSQT